MTTREPRELVTVADANPCVEYTVGATPQTDFQFPYTYFDEDDIEVWTRADAVTAWSQRFDWDAIPDSGFDETGFGSAVIRFNSAVSNLEVLIARAGTFARLTQFPWNGPMDFVALNREINRLVGLSQSLRMGWAQSIRVNKECLPKGDLSYQLPVDVADKVIGFDSSGDIQMYAPTAVSSVGPVGPPGAGFLSYTVTTHQQLRDVEVPMDGEVAYNPTIDLTYVFNASSIQTDNKATVLTATDGTPGAWEAVYNGYANVRWGEDVQASGFEHETTHANTNRLRFQALVDWLAANGGGFLYTPPTPYGFNIDHPVHCKSKVFLVGDGPASKWENWNSTSVLGTGLCVTFGTYDGGSFTEAGITRYAINNIARGTDADSVFCTTTNDAGNFSAGELVHIYSDTGYTTAGGKVKPLFQQINKVLEDGDVGTGELKLESPLYRDYSGGDLFIVRSGDVVNLNNNFTPELIERAGALNMGFGSRADGWTRYGGLFRGLVANINIDNSANLWACNGTAECLIHNIQGTTRNKFHEAAYFCHDSIFSNFIGKWENASSAFQELGAISFAEGVHNLLCIGHRADFGNGATASIGFKYGQGVQRCDIESCYVRAHTLKQLIASSNDKAADGMEYEDNCIRDSYLDVDTVTGWAISFGGVASSDSIGMTLDNVRVRTNNFTQGLLNIQASDILIDDCKFTAIPAGTALNSVSGSNNVVLKGNHFPAGVEADLLDMQSDGIMVERNIVRGRESLDSSQIFFASGSPVNTNDVVTGQATPLVSTLIKGGEIDEDDIWTFEIGGVTGSTDNATIELRYAGVVIVSVVVSVVADFHIKGLLSVVNPAKDSWRANWSQMINATVTAGRTLTTQTTSADNQLALHGYTDGPGELRIENFRLEPLRRY